MQFQSDNKLYNQSINVYSFGLMSFSHRSNGFDRGYPSSLVVKTTSYKDKVKT